MRARKNRRGVSDVVTTILLIGVTIAVVGIVWVVINGLVKDKIDNTQSCFGIFGKAEVNSRYTCYNSTSNKLQFSITIGDIDIEEMLVGVSSESSSSSFRLKTTPGSVSNVVYLNGSTSVKLPGKNSGLTYLLDLSSAGFSGAPDSIELVPVIDGNQCEAIDSLDQIDNCNLLS